MVANVAEIQSDIHCRGTKRAAVAIEAADDVGLVVHQLADLQDLFAIAVDALER